MISNTITTHKVCERRKRMAVKAKMPMTTEKNTSLSKKNPSSVNSPIWGWKWKFEQVKAKVWVSESVTLSEWKWKLEQEEVGHCMLLLKIRLPVRTNSNVESNFKSKGFPEIPKYDGCFKRWDIDEYVIILGTLYVLSDNSICKLNTSSRPWYVFAPNDDTLCTVYYVECHSVHHWWDQGVFVWNICQTIFEGLCNVCMYPY